MMQCAAQAFWLGVAGFALLQSATHAADDDLYFPPPESEGGWRTPTDAKQIADVAGLDVARLDEAWQYVSGLSKNSSLVVVRHGWLAYERYQGAATVDSNRDLHSCGKAFTSTAVGVLMEEHPDLFPAGLDQLVYTDTYLPPEAFPLTDPRKAKIKLGQLLSMSSGIRGNNPCVGPDGEVTIEPAGPDGSFPDDVAFGHATWKGTSAETMWADPGDGYSYASAGPLILAAMLRQITGKDVADYMREKVFDPIGWESWGWAKNPPEPDGSRHTKAQGGIQPSPRDAARFGYLHLHLGQWGEKQLLPEWHARAVRKPSPYNPYHPTYGMFFTNNADRRAFPAAPADTYGPSGALNNHIYTIPSLDMVVVRIGDRENTRDSFADVHRLIIEKVVAAAPH
jgi:CubicO group peptidase (beta-lactamase class C family)